MKDPWICMPRRLIFKENDVVLHNILDGNFGSRMQTWEFPRAQWPRLITYWLCFWERQDLVLVLWVFCTSSVSSLLVQNPIYFSGVHYCFTTRRSPNPLVDPSLFSPIDFASPHQQCPIRYIFPAILLFVYLMIVYSTLASMYCCVEYVRTAGFQQCEPSPIR